jgi:hypothetical protein
MCYLWERKEQGFGKKPDEQILLEEIARKILNFILRK